MQDFIPFLPLLLVWFLGAISPGPDFVMTVQNALVSRRAGFGTALGLGLGILVHVTYCLLGVAVLISQSILLFNALKYLAAFYLIYMGWRALRSSTMKDQALIGKKPSSKNISFSKAIRLGFLTNVLNPKVTVFFLGLFTIGINPGTPLFPQIVFGVIMAIGTALWFSIVAIFFSQHRVQRVFQKFSRAINRTFGGLLILLGIKIALTKSS